MLQLNTKMKKGQPGVYIALLVVVITSMVLLSKCSKTASSSIAEEKVLKVAIEYAPLSCYTYNDTIGGFSYDLLKLIAKHGGVKVDFTSVVTLNTSLSELRNGKYDIVVAEFPVTKESRDEYLFTDPIYLDREVLVQRKKQDGSRKINSQLDLAKDTVYVIKGAPMTQRLENLGREIGDTIYVKTEDVYGPEQLFIRVATGEVEYAVLNEKLSKQMGKKYPNVDITTGISFTQFQSWIVNKNNKELLDNLNKWLKEVKKTQEYEKLRQRYFESDKSTTPPSK